MREPRRPVAARGRAVDPPLPAVRARERVGLVAALVVGGEDRERPQPLALGRRGLEPPGEGRERLAPRPARDVVGREGLRDLLPERARLLRAALVGRGLAHEVEALGRRVCRPCRRGSGRAPRRRGGGAGGRAARRSSSSRNGVAGERRGRLPSSRPRTKTCSKRRVLARMRSSTGTRPARSPRAGGPPRARGRRRRPRARPARRAAPSPRAPRARGDSSRRRAGRPASARRPAAAPGRRRRGASRARARARPRSARPRP